MGHLYHGYVSHNPMVIDPKTVGTSEQKARPQRQARWGLPNGFSHLGFAHGMLSKPQDSHRSLNSIHDKKQPKIVWKLEIWDAGSQEYVPT